MRTQRLALIVASWVASGCPKVVPIDYEAPPRLPAPTAGSYGRQNATPADPVVASVVAGRPWEAYLSGGAAGIALVAVKAPVSLSPWALREDLWRAGYPYPIASAHQFDGVPEQPPPAEVAEWLATVPPSADLGLVRARSATRETWVGLVANPRVDVGAFPRALEPGTTMTLPEVRGGRFRIAEGDGGLLEGPLDDGWRSTLADEGEWVFQVIDAEGIAAWFPLYVGITPPSDNLLPRVPTPLGTEDEVIALVEDYLAMLRDAYGSVPWRRDVILDASARRLLSDPEATVGGVLKGLGVAEPHQGWSCTTPSVESCIDGIVWDPAHRRPFLSAAYTHVGIAAALEGAKARIRIVVSGG